LLKLSSNANERKPLGDGGGSGQTWLGDGGGGGGGGGGDGGQTRLVDRSGGGSSSGRGLHSFLFQLNLSCFFVPRNQSSPMNVSRMCSR
jgi:hypothetical protein